MRLAIFTSQFPSHVSTFFARDVKTLLEAGFDIEIFPIYLLEPGLWPSVPQQLDSASNLSQRVHMYSAKQWLGPSNFLITLITSSPTGETMPQLARTFLII